MIEACFEVDLVESTDNFFFRIIEGDRPEDSWIDYAYVKQGMYSSPRQYMVEEWHDEYSGVAYFDCQRYSDVTACNHAWLPDDQFIKLTYGSSKRDPVCIGEWLRDKWRDVLISSLSLDDGWAVMAVHFVLD